LRLVKVHKLNVCERPLFTNPVTIGDAEEQKCLKKFLCSVNEVFALSDHELGETDLVKHQIYLKQAISYISTKDALGPN